MFADNIKIISLLSNKIIKNFKIYNEMIFFFLILSIKRRIMINQRKNLLGLLTASYN